MRWEKLISLTRFLFHHRFGVKYLVISHKWKGY
jgi:hypothetical protein